MLFNYNQEWKIVGRYLTMMVELSEYDGVTLHNVVNLKNKSISITKESQGICMMEQENRMC